jgi:hypothetical protein
MCTESTAPKRLTASDRVLEGRPGPSPPSPPWMTQPGCRRSGPSGTGGDQALRDKWLALLPEPTAAPPHLDPIGRRRTQPRAPAGRGDQGADRNGSHVRCCALDEGGALLLSLWRPHGQPAALHRDLLASLDEPPGSSPWRRQPHPLMVRATGAAQKALVNPSSCRSSPGDDPAFSLVLMDGSFS